MRAGRAKLTLCSALLFAAFAPRLAAQDMSAKSDTIYSLVSAQAVDCPQGVVCVDNLSFGSFAHAKTLSGPDVGERFGAAIVTHLRLIDQPMLLIVEHRSDGSKVVRSFARASQAGGRACMSRLIFDSLGFLPSGADIEVNGEEVCTITPPVVPSMAIVTPVEVVTGKELILPVKRPQFRLAPIGSSGPVVLALIDIERGYPNGDWYCPPDTNWEEEICLGASIVVHPGTIVRRYGGSENVDPEWRAAKFKQIGGHAVRWVEGGYWLAIIEQTDEDYYYIQWKTDASQGRFCLPQAVIDHYRVEAKPDFKLNDDGDRCYAVRMSDSR